MAQKIRKRICLIGAALALTAGATWAQTGPTPSRVDGATGYPGEVALSQEGPNRWVYRRFPGGQRLYVYDRDTDGKSACNFGCDGARPPVYAPPEAQPKGLWTVIVRSDGTRQWAYKGHPVYSYYHDDPETPSGDGEGGVWHILPYGVSPDS
jgi:predicted lipoprotein with Yx(FWY)xxD motif